MRRWNAAEVQNNWYFQTSCYTVSHRAVLLFASSLLGKWDSRFLLNGRGCLFVILFCVLFVSTQILSYNIGSELNLVKLCPQSNIKGSSIITTRKMCVSLMPPAGNPSPWFSAGFYLQLSVASPCFVKSLGSVYSQSTQTFFKVSKKESESENILDTFVRDRRTQFEWSARFLLHTWTSQESSCLVIALSLAFAEFCFFIFRHICTREFLLCFKFVYLFCSYNLSTSICHGIRSYIWIEFCSLLLK